MFIPSTFSAFHDETGRLNVDGMNIISNDGSNKLNRSRKARVSYKVQRTINASLNAATSTRAVSSNPNFVTRQKIEIILVMVVFFIAFRWIHLSTPLIRLFLLVLILLLMPTLNFLPVWFALSLLRFRLPSRLPMMFILWMVAMMVVIIPSRTV